MLGVFQYCSAGTHVEGVAVSITDRTCLTETGLTPRAWRRALDELRVPHAKVGRRTVCTARAWTDAIERASGVELAPVVLSDDEFLARALA